MEKSTGETSSNQERFARWLANLEQNLKVVSFYDSFPFLSWNLGNSIRKGPNWNDSASY